MSSLVKYISLEILTKELLLEIWYTKLILLFSSKKTLFLVLHGFYIGLGGCVALS